MNRRKFGCTIAGIRVSLKYRTLYFERLLLESQQKRDRKVEIAFQPLFMILKAYFAFRVELCSPEAFFLTLNISNFAKISSSDDLLVKKTVFFLAIYCMRIIYFLQDYD